MFSRWTSRALKGSSLWMDAWKLTQSRNANRTVLVQLLKDVDKLGQAGDVVYVKPGRMRNHLYPNKEALYAKHDVTPTEKTEIRKDVKPFTKEELAYHQLTTVLNRLTSRTLKIRRPLKEGEEDAPITNEVICRFVKEHMRILLSPSLLDLEEPIQTSGDYQIPLKFSLNGVANYSLKVNVTDQSTIESNE